MSNRTFVHARSLRALTSLLIAIWLITSTRTVHAGAAGFRNSSVGGISINVAGVVGPPRDDAKKKVLALLRKEVKEAPAEMTAPIGLRMISLRGLAEACDEALKKDFGRLPDEVRFLAGIQRIQYVFVYPDENDIVLAGPAEGWRVNDEGNVVGVTTGHPVLRLDDLLVALRHVHDARTAGITCSINPTEEGHRKLKKVLDEQRRRRRVIPEVLEPAIKQAFGPQQVSISGVPLTSHFARVLVAADYRMKRMAMKLEKTPVAGFPSYLDMIKSRGARVATDINPRWWLACDYQPLAASEDGLAWELRGPGVKAMTEDDFVAEDGTATGTGRASPAAQKWADMMSDKYGELSVEDAVFGELRNLMDMCVVAALIEKERLWEKASLSVPLLTQADSKFELETWNAPKTVPPEVSFLRTRNSWIVTASGGVEIGSWQVASNQEINNDVRQVRQQAASRSGSSLWWQ